MISAVCPNSDKIASLVMYLATTRSQLQVAATTTQATATQARANANHSAAQAQNQFANNTSTTRAQPIATNRTDQYRLEPIVSLLISEALKTAEQSHALLQEAFLMHALTSMRESVFVALLRALHFPTHSHPPSHLSAPSSSSSSSCSSSSSSSSPSCIYQHSGGCFAVSKELLVRMLHEACALAKHQVVFYMVTTCEDLINAPAANGKRFYVHVLCVFVCLYVL